MRLLTFSVEQKFKEIKLKMQNRLCVLVSDF